MRKWYNVGVKLKQNPLTYKWKNCYGKLWIVNASNFEWVECEHINKTVTIEQLETQTHQVKCRLDLLQKRK